jgi:hypothetical protein
MATLYGTVARLQVGPDGRLEAAHAAPDFFARASADAASLEVELDAGTTAVYHRVAADAVLPDGLEGVYANDEIAATWTIRRDGGALTLRVDGPHVRSGRWEIAAIEGDMIRILPPARLYRSWIDARVQRDEAGAVVGLAVNGGRARRLSFARLDTQTGTAA